ncbi:MAG: endopeptidase La [Prevotellaceae bacterium]|jgi:ATP-dependent Lon protease|nr:endopeptidase La [Prevotellaceae bacterium]
MAVDIKLRQIFLEGDDVESVNYIPLSFDEDFAKINTKDLPESLPILTLRNSVLFPEILIPITVGREKSIKLVREIYSTSKILGAVAQSDSKIDNPTKKDLNKIGTVARILRILEMPDGAITAVLQGVKRFEIRDIIDEDPYFVANVKYLSEEKPKMPNENYDAIISSVKDIAVQIIRQSPMPQEVIFAIKNIERRGFLINYIGSNLDITHNVSDQQALLEIGNLKDRALKLLEILQKELKQLEIKNDIQRKVRHEIDQQQREYYLHQQMKTIQDELGENPAEQDIAELRERAKTKKWSDETGEFFEKETAKLERMNPAVGEFSVQLTYLQLLLDLPWNEYTEDSLDIKKAQKILDEDHYGLDKVKDRILEYLAVIKLKNDLKSPIICLYGPPGIGKTSLGKSIARAIGREFGRISLGGLHDEAEIRGHRKTYIGAMPGRIIQTIKRCKSANPVIILDEIDKIGNDFRGDPASALLEVLDPEQNSTFHDNYIDLNFDLSKTMFITTANNIGTINPALRDRMEMIPMSGYLVEEKIEIAKRHLIPKQLDAHGIKPDTIVLNNDVIEIIIESYTKESGVRSLDKQIAKVARYYAKQIALNERITSKISKEKIREILGVPIFTKDEYQGNDFAGVVTGLAWTELGGEILFIETSLSKGKGKLTITGNLGEVMKESALIALEYVKAHADMFNIDYSVFEKWDIHLHVPEGAIPKDGPSAGITMATAIASAFTQRKVRKGIAMTGEITLRGKVLPVGGIKEKILAAKRAGINDIVLSKDNEKDINEIKAIYVKGIKFNYIETITDVFNFALLKEKVKNAVNIE